MDWPSLEPTVPKLKVVPKDGMQDYYKWNLDYRIAYDRWHLNDANMYCKFCCWTTSFPENKYCPYGHGAMSPIKEYTGYLLKGI